VAPAAGRSARGVRSGATGMWMTRVFGKS